MAINYDQVTKIKVFGVGGAGCNAVNRMVEDGMQGVEFYVANTDLQVLNSSLVDKKIFLGRETSGGRGAGANPKIGKEAALESEAEIREAVKGSDMVFIAAGMGGGTGTGASPLFAKVAKEEGALTVGIVTKPFYFEGNKKMDVALAGIEELKMHVDSLIIIPNNRLLEIFGAKPLVDSFREADNVLRQGVQTITDLIAVSTMINLDFADVKSVMEGQGAALIGIGMAKGDNKSIDAANEAINSPLLETKISGAKKAIINVTGGSSMSGFDVQKAVEFITEAAGKEVEVIFGAAINENLGENIIVTVIATGFEERNNVYRSFPNSEVKTETIVEPEEDDIPGFFKNR